MKASVRFRTKGLKLSYVTNSHQTSDHAAPAMKLRGRPTLLWPLLVGLFLWLLNPIGSQLFWATERRQSGHRQFFGASPISRKSERLACGSCATLGVAACVTNPRAATWGRSVPVRYTPAALGRSLAISINLLRERTLRCGVSPSPHPYSCRCGCRSGDRCEEPSSSAPLTLWRWP